MAMYAAASIINDKYEVREKIGGGSNGIVKMPFFHRAT